MTTTTVSETFCAAKDKVQEARRTASQYVGQAGTVSEETLHNAAETVRRAGTRGADTLDSIADTTGRKFASAASYLDPSAPCSMMEDLRKVVMRHPGAFLAGAAAFACAIGFMAGSGASRTGNGRSGY